MALGDLEANLDRMLVITDNGSVLPSAHHLDPNTSMGWAKTKSAMMPGIKTKKQRAGDPAYGAGASSGSKAARARAPAKNVPKRYVFLYHMHANADGYFPQSDISHRRDCATVVDDCCTPTDDRCAPTDTVCSALILLFSILPTSTYTSFVIL